MRIMRVGLQLRELCLLQMDLLSITCRVNSCIAISIVPNRRVLANRGLFHLGVSNGPMQLIKIWLDSFV